MRDRLSASIVVNRPPTATSKRHKARDGLIAEEKQIQRSPTMAYSQPKSLLIESFCEGRYERLKPYVQYASVGDWAKMDALEVAELTPLPELRMLMAIFHRDLESRGLFTAPQQDFYGPGPALRTLNLSRAVTSKAFTSSGRTLATVLELSTQEQLEKLDAIDIRFCNLLDMDAEDVLALCLKAVGLGATRLIVDVSGNRFTPDAIPVFKDICLLQGVEHVFAPEVGHYGAQAELARLTPEALAKLIFVRHSQLAAQGWKNIVPDSSAAVVQNAHDTFYARYPTFAESRL
jgi:hypothetical protein